MGSMEPLMGRCCGGCGTDEICRSLSHAADPSPAHLNMVYLFMNPMAVLGNLQLESDFDFETLTQRSLNRETIYAVKAFEYGIEIHIFSLFRLVKR